MPYTETAPIAVGLGEILWDCLPEGKRIGGAPFNFSRFADHCGMIPVPVTAIGEDADGDAVIATLKKLDITTRVVSRVHGQPTGLVTVALDERGVPKYTIAAPAAWDFIPETPELKILTKKAAAVCFGTLAQRNPASRAVIRGFLDQLRPDCLRVLDLNLRAPFFDREVILESLKRCTILKLSAEEFPAAAELLQLPAERQLETMLHQYRLQAIILTKGAEGATYFDRHHRFDVPAVSFGPVKDTVGCGDAFTAAFIASRVRGEGARESMTAASELAGKVAAGQFRVE